MEPTPVVDPDNLDRFAEIGAEAVTGLFLVTVIAGTLAFVLLRAATRQPEAMVTVAISILTLVAIVGFITTQAEALITLAGTGIGALAGALTSLFGKKATDDHLD